MNSDIIKNNLKDLWDDEELYEGKRGGEKETYKNVEEYQDQVQYQETDNYIEQSFHKHQKLYQSSSIYNKGENEY